jgi:hypothetical protein
MSSRPVQPAIDAYGTYARASNLADYLELLALQGESLLESELEDLVRDREWVVRLENELFIGPAAEPRDEFDDADPVTEGPAAENDGAPQSARVFDVLQQRGELLGEFYPFEVSNRVSLKAGVDVRQSNYVALLALTTAHAHKIEVRPNPGEAPIDPKQVLEAVVVRALERLGLTCANVGEISRGAIDFRETVTRAGTAVGLSPTPLAAVSLTNANEEGVDALAHLALADQRAGHWVFIGQVTCGKSDTWKGKLDEPKAPDWKLYLNILVGPQGFLAVPHHVEAQHLTKLVQGGDRMVLDRIRLTRFSPGVSENELAIINAVLDAGTERPSGRETG